MPVSSPQFPDAVFGAVGTTAVGGGHAAVLADASDATYIYQIDGPGFEQKFSVSDVSIPAGCVHRYTTVHARAYDNSGAGSSYIQVRLLQNGATVWADSGYAYIYPGSWQEFTAVDPVFRSQIQLNFNTISLNTYPGDPQNQNVLVSRAWIDFVYANPPSAPTMTGPAATVSVAQPTISWTHNPGADSVGGQTYYQVRVFSAAQYGAGGFDPSTSGATTEIGQTAGAGTSWQTGVLANTTTYRAYVRTWQQTNGQDQVSPWNFVQFTTNIPVGPVATITGDAQILVGGGDVQQPTVTWTHTPGLYGGAQTHYQVIVRNNDTGVDLYASGVVAGSATSMVLPAGMVHLTPYTVYVATAQSPLGSPQWSAFAAKAYRVVLHIIPDPVSVEITGLVIPTLNQTGVRDSPPFDLTNSRNSDNSIISWVVALNSGTFTVWTSVDYGQTYQQATSGQRIPGLAELAGLPAFPTELLVRQVFGGSAPYSVLTSLTLTAGEDLLTESLDVRWAYTSPDLFNPTIEKTAVRRTGSVNVRGELPNWFDAYNFYFEPFLDVGTDLPYVSEPFETYITTNGTYAVNYSGDVQLGDILVMDIMLVYSGGTLTASTPAGFTQVASQTSVGGSIGSLAAVPHTMLHKVCTKEVTAEITSASTIIAGTSTYREGIVRSFVVRNAVAAYSSSAAVSAQSENLALPLTPPGQLHLHFVGAGFGINLFAGVNSPAITREFGATPYWDQTERIVAGEHGLTGNLFMVGPRQVPASLNYRGVWNPATMWASPPASVYGDWWHQDVDHPGTSSFRGARIYWNGTVHKLVNPANQYWDMTVPITDWELNNLPTHYQHHSPGYVSRRSNRVGEAVVGKAQVWPSAYVNIAEWNRVSLLFTPARTSTLRFSLGRLFNTLPVINDDGILVTTSFQLADKSHILATREIGEAREYPPDTDIKVMLTDMSEVQLGDEWHLFSEIPDGVLTTQPFVFEASDVWGTVCNTLLENVGYGPVWVDLDGMYRTEPAYSETDITPEWRYVAGSPMVTAATVESVLQEVPNQIRFLAANGPSLVEEGNGLVTLSNTDQGPASIVQRGVVVPVTLTYQVEDQEALERVAASEAQRYFAGGGVRLSMAVALNPLHDDRDVVEVAKPRVGLPTLAPYAVTEWSLHLGTVDSESSVLMQLKLNQLVFG